MNKKISFLALTILIFLFSLIICSSESYAQLPSDSTDYFTQPGNFRIELSLLGGVGFKTFDVGKTTDNETINISPGGGFGGKIAFGYYITSLLIFSAEIGGQESTLSQEVKNAKGSFSRFFAGGTVKYMIPVSRKSSINIGAGGDYIKGGKFDLDFSEVTNGGHNIFKYKPTAGLHLLAEYEIVLPQIQFLNAVWSVNAGIRYDNIKYKLNSIDASGTSIPIDSPAARAWKDVDNIDGSGINVLVGFSMNI